MLNVLVLFAQAADEGKQAAPDSGFAQTPMFMVLMMMAAFFLLIVWPSQRKQKQEREAIMTGLKKNDEVVTTAGIIGIVAYIKDTGDEVTLKIDDNARIRVLKSSIARIVKKDETKDGAASASTNIKPV